VPILKLRLLLKCRLAVVTVVVTAAVAVAPNNNLIMACSTVVVTALFRVNIFAFFALCSV